MPVHDLTRKNWPEFAALVDDLEKLDGSEVTVTAKDGGGGKDKQKHDRIRARMFLYTGSQR